MKKIYTLFTWRKLFNFFNTILLLFFGIFVCAYSFYIRVLLIRLPYEIGVEFNVYKFISYVYLTILFSYLLKQKIKPTKNENFLFKKVKENFLMPIAEFYDKSLDTVHFYFIDHKDRLRLKGLLGECLYKIADFCTYVDSKDSYYFFYIYYFFNFLPRLVILGCLYVDVFYRGEFYYTYKCIGVLILILLWKVCYYLLKQNLELTLEFYSLYFIKIIVTDPEELKRVGASEPFLYCKVRKDAIVQKRYPVDEAGYREMFVAISKLEKVKHRFFAFLENVGTRSAYCDYAQVIIYVGSIIIWGYLAVITGVIYLK